MTLSRTSSGIYLPDIIMWIFPSWTSLISYRVFLWHTYPWLVMFSGKQIQRMSTGRKNVFIVRPENGAEWRNAALKPTGQRSSRFVVDGRFGNLWIWGNAAAWAPAWRQHSSSMQNIQICMKVREDCIPQASVWVRFWRSRLCVPALVHICVADRVWGVSDDKGPLKAGPTVGAEGRYVNVNVNARRGTKITNPLNNSLRPRHKACANISSSACYLLVDALCLRSWNLGTSDFVQWKLSGRWSVPLGAKLKLHITFKTGLHENTPQVSNNTKGLWCSGFPFSRQVLQSSNTRAKTALWAAGVGSTS